MYKIYVDGKSIPERMPKAGILKFIKDDKAWSTIRVVSPAQHPIVRPGGRKEWVHDFCVVNRGDIDPRFLAS